MHFKKCVIKLIEIEKLFVCLFFPIYALEFKKKIYKNYVKTCGLNKQQPTEHCSKHFIWKIIFKSF